MISIIPLPACPLLCSVLYRELGDGEITETLSRHLKNYQEHMTRGQRQVPLPPSVNIVLFRSAIEHITRLCRVMVRTCMYACTCMYMYMYM